MPTYIGSVASNHMDTDNDLYTRECLQVIEDQIKGKIVTWEFKGDSIGEVINAYTINDGEFVRAVIRLNEPADKPKVYAVIAFSHTSDDYTLNDMNGRSFHNITVMGVGLTTDPADESLEPIQMV